jgi:hypothetical protein
MSSNVRVYNLGGIRQAVYGALGWGPKASAEAEDRVDEFINRAYFRLVLETPLVFFRDEQRFTVLPDFQSRGAVDTLRLATCGGALAGEKDPWCFITDAALADAHPNFRTDGTLSGRIILLQDAAGRWHERTIREVFTVPVDPTTNKYAFTVTEPWIEDQPVVNWRLRQGGFNLPNDVVEIQGCKALVGDWARDVEIVHENTEPAIQYNEAVQVLAWGWPRYAHRREYRALPAPTFLPTLDVAGEEVPVFTPTPWAGPENIGSFQYCFTYALGRHDLWRYSAGPSEQTTTLTSMDRTRQAPWLESPPSQLSDIADVTTSAVEVRLPNLVAMLGFEGADTARYRRTGLVKRIYRRRVVDGATDPELESPDRFYLIDEVPAHQTTWVDDGSKVPDYLTPMRPAHGYQTLEFRPAVGEAMEFVLEYIRMPVPLTDPQDVPRINEAGIEMLVALSCALALEATNASLAGYHLTRYEQARRDFAERASSARPKSQPTVIGRPRVINRRGIQSTAGLRLPRT